jgi:hypothetical protein
MRPFRFAVCAAFVLAAAGCSSPCERLLQKVCDCPGEIAKSACAEAKARQAAHDQEVLNKEKCRKELETFQCKSLK